MTFPVEPMLFEMSNKCAIFWLRITAAACDVFHPVDLFKMMWHGYADSETTRVYKQDGKALNLNIEYHSANVFKYNISMHLDQLRVG